MNEEILNQVYKNAHVALQSISNVLPETENTAMKDELMREYDGYEKIIGEISEYMAKKNYQPKDINPMKKAMLFTSIKMNALGDDSKSHIAEMMVKGTVMGICELRRLISEHKFSVDAEVTEFAKKLLSLEEGYEETLKSML